MTLLPLLLTDALLLLLTLTSSWMLTLLTADASPYDVSETRLVIASLLLISA